MKTETRVCPTPIIPPILANSPNGSIENLVTVMSISSSSSKTIPYLLCLVWNPCSSTWYLIESWLVLYDIDIVSSFHLVILHGGKHCSLWIFPLLISTRRDSAAGDMFIDSLHQRFLLSVINGGVQFKAFITWSLKSISRH